MKCQVVVKKEPEDEGYYAYSPTLPGCFSNGKSIEETVRNMREAARLHVESLVSHGQPIPEIETGKHADMATDRMPERVPVRELIAFLTAYGFVEERRVGNQLTLWNERQRTSVTFPDDVAKDVGCELAICIINDAGLSVEAFLRWR